jgi:hypothetical protein
MIACLGVGFSTSCAFRAAVCLIGSRAVTYNGFKGLWRHVMMMRFSRAG